MNTTPETPALKNPQSATPHGSPHSTRPPSATPQDPPSETGNPAPRPRKDVLLPEVARLALEGHSGRAIAMELGVPTRTVNHWILELRRQWSSSAKGTAAETFSLTVARLESVYNEAMETWRRSKNDQQARPKPAAEGEEGGAKPRGSTRTGSRSGQAALLGKAMQAALAISKVEERHLEYRRDKVECGHAKLANLLEEIENLTEEEEEQIVAMYRVKHPEWPSNRDKDGQPAKKESS